MTFKELLKLLDAHGIIYEKLTSQSIKAYTVANSNTYDIIECMGNTMFLNGSTNFNIWGWLGY